MKEKKTNTLSWEKKEAEVRSYHSIMNLSRFIVLSFLGLSVAADGECTQHSIWLIDLSKLELIHLRTHTQTTYVTYEEAGVDGTIVSTVEEDVYPTVPLQ